MTSLMDEKYPASTLVLARSAKVFGRERLIVVFICVYHTKIVWKVNS